MANRGHGEGSIFQKADGSWLAQATVGRNYKTGKSKRVTYYGKTRKEVQEKLAKAIHDHQNGAFIEPSKLTFAEWLDIWLNEYVKHQVRPTTFDSYGRWINNHIKPGLGGFLLKDLQPSQIQRFYNQKLKEPKLNGREGTLSVRSVRYMHTLIHESLEQALRENKIVRNPAKATKPPRSEKKEATYLNSEQISCFLESIVDDRWYAAFITVLGSGLRLGELTALRWENLDLQKGIIQVKEAVSRVRSYNSTGAKTKMIFQSPKTQKGFRTIPLPDYVVAELKRWRAKQNQEKLLLQASGLYQDQGFVFAWPNGKMAEPGNLSKHFLKLIRENGFENIHFHSLRHSYASLMLKADVHPKIVQENLGHATISMTLDTYSHVAPGLKEAAAMKLNGVLQIKRPSLVEEG